LRRSKHNGYRNHLEVPMSSSTVLRSLSRGLTLAAVALVAACGGDSGGPSGPSSPDPDPIPSPTPEPQPEPGPVSGLEGRAIFGLTCANQLVLFGSGNPEVLQRQVPITGMAPGAVMLGIEFGASQLYGVGSDSRMYTVDTLTGAATPAGDVLVPGASGEHFGLAYDGTRNLFHLSSAESNQNLTIDGSNGAVSDSGPELAYDAADQHAGSNPAVVAEASLGPALYGVESNENAVVRVSPSTGHLTTLAVLPFNVYVCSGLDIDTDGTAYAALSTDSGSELYTIDLDTGATELLGSIAGSSVHSIALRP
jgi:hypothetical protein